MPYIGGTFYNNISDVIKSVYGSDTHPGGVLLPSLGTMLGDSSDLTKNVNFNLVGITAGAIRTLTIQNSNHTVAGLELAQTFTNEILIQPSVSTYVPLTLRGHPSQANNLFNIQDAGGLGLLYMSAVGKLVFGSTNVAYAGTPRFWLYASTGQSEPLMECRDPADAIMFQIGKAGGLTDTYLKIVDEGDTTKRLLFQVSGITTATDRTWTVQDVSGTVYVSGGSDIPVADGGTGASTAAAARVNILPSLTGNTLKHLRVNAGGTDVEWAGLPRSLFDNYADVSVGGAETDIYSVTTAASTFDANGAKVLANYGGNFVTIGTESVQLQVKFAGTTIWDSTGIAVSTGTSSWRVYAELIRVSATVVRYSVSLNTTGASGFVYCTVGELTGLTLSNTNILKITGTSSGVGSGVGDIVGKMSSVVYQPAA